MPWLFRFIISRPIPLMIDSELNLRNARADSREYWAQIRLLAYPEMAIAAVRITTTPALSFQTSFEPVLMPGRTWQDSGENPIDRCWSLLGLGQECKFRVRRRCRICGVRLQSQL